MTSRTLFRFQCIFRSTGTLRHFSDSGPAVAALGESEGLELKAPSLPFRRSSYEIFVIRKLGAYAVQIVQKNLHFSPLTPSTAARSVLTAPPNSEAAPRFVRASSRFFDFFRGWAATFGCSFGLNPERRSFAPVLWCAGHCFPVIAFRYSHTVALRVPPIWPVVLYAAAGAHLFHAAAGVHLFHAAAFLFPLSVYHSQSVGVWYRLICSEQTSTSAVTARPLFARLNYSAIRVCLRATESGQYYNFRILGCLLTENFQSERDWGKHACTEPCVHHFPCLERCYAIWWGSNQLVRSPGEEKTIESVVSAGRPLTPYKSN